LQLAIAICENKMRHITVDFANKTIELTKNFSKRAGVVGSVEYQTLLEVMRDFPNYNLHVENAPKYYNQSPYSRLTYSDMEEYINQNVDESQRHQKLLELRYQKEILGFARAKALFIQEYLKPEEIKKKETVA
jgi:hypothetical protein